VTTRNRMTEPLYAAAGAGSLAVDELRKLVADLRERANQARSNLANGQNRVDLERLRDIARRNAEKIMTRARIAGQRATVVYNDLVQRGEQVVNNARTKTEDTTGTTRQLPRGRRRS